MLLEKIYILLHTWKHNLGSCGSQGREWRSRQGVLELGSEGVVGIRFAKEEEDLGYRKQNMPRFSDLRITYPLEDGQVSGEPGPLPSPPSWPVGSLLGAVGSVCLLVHLLDFSPFSLPLCRMPEPLSLSTAWG